MNRFNNVIFGQKVFIVNHKKEILILKRDKQDVYKGMWDLPGGKLEDDENLLQAIHREIKEETGLELETVIVALSTSKFKGVAQDNPWMFRNLYLCTATGDINLSSEHSEFMWVPVEMLHTYNLPPDNDIQYVVTKLPDLLANMNLQQQSTFLI